MVLLIVCRNQRISTHQKCNKRKLLRKMFNGAFVEWNIPLNIDCTIKVIILTDNFERVLRQHTILFKKDFKGQNDYEELS